MFGILFVGLWAVFAEIGTSIGKYEMETKKESLYAFGFLHAAWATIFLLIIGLFIRQEFVFSLASLPTFILRALCEIAMTFVSINAILKADRSTNSFLGIITIPLLMLFDFGLGYSINANQMWGMIIIIVALVLLSLNKGLSKNGKKISIISALLSAITISLYKYNITNFNSVEAENSLMLIIIMITLLMTAWIKTKENLFSYFRRPVFLYQSLASGISIVFISFAYLFAPASIVTTAKRAFNVTTSIISGKAYFREKHIALKTIALVLIVLGTFLMVIY